jgi:hypothetical protein
MRGIFLFLVAVAFLTPAARSIAEPYASKVGRRHPNFTLPDIRTGKPVSLSDFHGKKVLLIHFASW